jgi:hypothetical protein
VEDHQRFAMAVENPKGPAAWRRQERRTSLVLFLALRHNKQEKNRQCHGAYLFRGSRGTASMLFGSLHVCKSLVVAPGVMYVVSTGRGMGKKSRAAGSLLCGSFSVDAQSTVVRRNEAFSLGGKQAFNNSFARLTSKVRPGSFGGTPVLVFDDVNMYDLDDPDPTFDNDKQKLRWSQQLGKSSNFFLTVSRGLPTKRVSLVTTNTPNMAKFLRLCERQ